MTARLIDEPAMAERRRLPLPVAQAAALAKRSIISTARQPTVVIPSMFFPLMIAAVNSAAMSRTTALPGFPEVDSFLQFLLPATIVQGVLLGGISAGSDVALDVQDGFWERLVVSPVSRVSILVGRLSGAAVLGALQALLFIALFVLFGAPIVGGLGAVLVLVLMAMLLSVFVGGFGAAMGLRTGSQEAVQSTFPLVFILMFMSSAFFPTSLMTGWYASVANNNPLTWLVDGARALVISDFAFDEALRALGVSLVLAVATVAWAAYELRRRLRVAS